MGCVPPSGGQIDYDSPSSGHVPPDEPFSFSLVVPREAAQDQSGEILQRLKRIVVDPRGGGDQHQSSGVSGSDGDESETVWIVHRGGLRGAVPGPRAAANK